MAEIGTSTAIVFGTSSFSHTLLDVSWDSQTREAIETSHMGTTGYRTFMPGDLVDPGEISMEIEHDPDEPPPITLVAEPITITFPLVAGGSTAATWACSGFITSFSASVPMEDKMVSSVSVKLTGTPTYVDATP